MGNFKNWETLDTNKYYYYYNNNNNNNNNYYYYYYYYYFYLLKWQANERMRQQAILIIWIGSRSLAKTMDASTLTRENF